jgi:hypothetical protein
MNIKKTTHKDFRNYVDKIYTSSLWMLWNDKIIIDEYLKYYENWLAINLIFVNLLKQDCIDKELWNIIVEFLEKYPANWYDVQKYVEKELIKKIQS